MRCQVGYILFTIFIILTSPAFSQTQDKSLHPKLDKYYPQKNNTPPAAATPQIVAPPVAETKPVTDTKPVAETKPVADTKPILQTAVPPQQIAVEKPAVEEPAPVTKPVVETDPVKALTDSNSLVNPVKTVIAQPEPKKTAIQPVAKPTSVYMDTRLGSSSPLYDTYETNNNGAGSITTMPKR